VSVERKSGEYFFDEVASAIVTGGQFEVHASPLAIASFIFDSNIGHGNPSANDLKSVLLGDGVFAISGIAVFAELCEIVIETLLQFVVGTTRVLPPWLPPFADFETKNGHRFLKQTQSADKAQTLYHGFDIRRRTSTGSIKKRLQKIEGQGGQKPSRRSRLRIEEASLSRSRKARQRPQFR